jgi:hypothetical protein
MDVEFEASVAVYMTSSLFWDVTQSILVLTDASGQPIGPIFKGKAIHCLVREDESGKLSRNVGNYLPIYVA